MKSLSEILEAILAGATFDFSTDDELTVEAKSQIEQSLLDLIGEDDPNSYQNRVQYITELRDKIREWCR